MRLVICLFFFLFLTACISRPIGQAYCHIPAEGWRKVDTLTLTVVPDSMACVGTGWEIIIDVRHTNAYSYGNLNIGLMTPQGDTVISLSLLNERGMWKGNGLGYMYQSSYKAGVYCPDKEWKDTLHFQIISLMPDSLLQGVHDLGIRLLAE